jgi:iron complex outermembrane receptor protein
MMTRRSFYSVYDDHSGGGTAEFTTRIVPRNTFSASFTLKDDTHKEYSYYARNSYTTPTTLDRLQTFSIGFQDVITITSRLRATFGFSADYLRGLQVQDLNDDEDEIIPIQCLSDPNNTSLSGCTPHIWTYNPQASVSYSFTNQDTLFVTFADRGRFPIMKEMYTTAFGSRLPNPELRPEHSRNWNIGYSHAFSGRTIAQIEYFHNNLRDAINDVYVIDPGSQCPESDLDGFCEQWANVAEEVHQGVEMSIRSTPISRLTLDVNYSYLNRNIDYASDIELIDPRFMILRTLPKNKVIFNAFFELPRNILILGTYRYEGGINVQDQTYNDPPPEYSTSYGTVDLGGVIPVCKGWSMQVGVKNLFDRYYYYTPGYPEIGRNWYLNSRFRF